MDLRQLLDETGYDLVMKEPMSGDPMSEDPMMEEDPEDMGPEDAEEEMAEEGSDEAMDLMQSLMPPGMGKPHDNENPRMKVRRMTMVAAHKAMPKDKKGRE
tara:strand:- start:193 stop:495 length:303 start_codon:yes stop_codon:yes gene_type:complete